MLSYSILRRTISATAIVAVLQALPPPLMAKQCEESRLQKGQSVVSTEQKPSGEHFVKARILVHAPPQTVWDMVHVERHNDPDLEYSKIIEQKSPQQCLLEEKFVILPVIGTATCLMEMTEVPYERIEFKMVKSDHFKAMEGAWSLTPVDGGKSTILELKSRLEMGIQFPHAIVDNITGNKLSKRVARVRDMSEKEARVATTGARRQS